MKKKWTEIELKKIKKHILLRNNLEIKDGALVKAKAFERNLTNVNSSILNSNTYDCFYKTIEKILFNTSEEEIQEVLDRVNGIKQMVESDPSNPFYRGTLINISRVNPEDQSEIFVIFNEIISQYNRTINSVVTKSIEGITDEAIIRKKIQNIKDIKEPSLEEMLVIDNIKKTFSLTNGITSADMFKEIIAKCNENIKEQIIRLFYGKLTTIINQNNMVTKQNLINFDAERKNKFAKKESFSFTDIRTGTLKNR